MCKIRILAGAMSLALLALFSGCVAKPSQPDDLTPTMEPTHAVEQLPTQAPTAEPTAEPTQAPTTEPTAAPTDAPAYTIVCFTDAPNAASTVSIDYPQFGGAGMEALNALIKERVQGLGSLDASLEDPNAALTLNYQTAVTLQNERYVSVIFYGTSFIEGAAHDFSDLVAVNYDLQAQKEVTLAELYMISDAFVAATAAQAAYPSAPRTSCSEEEFAEQLALQETPLFTAETLPTFFLKAEGVVFSLPAIHATGYDHFELQLSYDALAAYRVGGNA